MITVLGRGRVGVLSVALLLLRLVLLLLLLLLLLPLSGKAGGREKQDDEYDGRVACFNCPVLGVVSICWYTLEVVVVVMN